MTPELQILLLWWVFGGTHIWLSSLRTRAKWVERLGESRFIGVYSLIALAIFIPLNWIYFSHLHQGAMFWSVPRTDLLRWVMYLVNGTAFVLIVAGLIRPSASMMMVKDASVTGVLRITRHPLFMGVGLLSAMHLVPNGWATDVAYFGGMLAYLMIGLRHQDQRMLAERGDEFRSFYDATCFFPFMKGQVIPALKETPIWILALSVAAATGARLLH